MQSVGFAYVLDRAGPRTLSHLMFSIYLPHGVDFLNKKLFDRRSRSPAKAHVPRRDPRVSYKKTAELALHK
jgi:hypothetical protein